MSCPGAFLRQEKDDCHILRWLYQGFFLDIKACVAGQMLVRFSLCYMLHLLFRQVTCAGARVGPVSEDGSLSRPQESFLERPMRLQPKFSRREGEKESSYYFVWPAYCEAV